VSSNIPVVAKVPLQATKTAGTKNVQSQLDINPSKHSNDKDNTKQPQDSTTTGVGVIA